MLAILAFCCALADPLPHDALSARPLTVLEIAEESSEQDEIVDGAAVRAASPFVHAEPRIAKRVAHSHRNALLDTMRLNI